MLHFFPRSFTPLSLLFTFEKNFVFQKENKTKCYLSNNNHRSTILATLPCFPWDSASKERVTAVLVRVRVRVGVGVRVKNRSRRSLNLNFFHVVRSQKFQNRSRRSLNLNYVMLFARKNSKTDQGGL
jgi:hypothetical protein